MANAGEYHISGSWGEARNQAGELIAEIIEFTATVEIGRIDVPLVGTLRSGHKTGRETREGTMRVQKVDSKWEWEVYKFLSQSVDQRRTARDAGTRYNPEFSITIALDDPEALGVEKWQFDGVRVWRLPLGFSIADEQVEREYPITWESETPLRAFKKKRGVAAAEAIDVTSASTSRVFSV